MSKQPIPYDPSDAVTTNWRDYFVAHKDDMFSLKCEDGEAIMNGRWMFLNIMLCMPLIKRRRPINKSKHIHPQEIFSANSHKKITTEIVKTLQGYGYTRDELGHDILLTVQDAHNACYTHLGSYVCSMDLYSMAETILQEGIEEHTKIDYDGVEEKNIQQMEDLFKERSENITSVLKSDKFEKNIFRAPLLCGSVKEAQFHQFILSAGPRTDADDSMILRPVVGSFLGGMRDIVDLVIESRSATKSTHYNKTQMPTTSYNNRKISIQNSIVSKLYPGDCGSEKYIWYTVSKKNMQHMSGRFYLGEDGRLHEITPDLYDVLDSKPIQVRDPITCKYTNGYCQVCGGTITNSFGSIGNVGLLSNVNTGAPVQQQVLSAKHLILTNAAEYQIPDPLQFTLTSSMNNIFLTNQMRSRISGIAFGFRPEDLAQLNDLRYHEDDMNIPAKRFTNIKFMYPGIVRKDGSIVRNGSRIPMGGAAQIYPHLSPEILHVIRNNPQDMETIDGIVWFRLRNINPEMPVMQCTVVNNSIKLYVQSFSSLVTRDVARYRSANEFMRVLTQLVWDRVGTHSTHIACLAKACLITSRHNFNVPVVDDPDNVMFGTLNRNIAMRSIGCLVAFERYNQVTNRPATYFMGRVHTDYDEFMGYKDTIERDMNWPEFGNTIEIPMYNEE